MVKRFSIAFICIAILAVSFVMVQNWNISDNNTIKFKIKSALGMVDGTIGGLQGTVVFDPADPASGNLDVTLDPATINTGNTKRDNDIKEEDNWFDTGTYPKISFTSDAITKTGAGYNVSGTLKMKGTKKKINIPFTFAAAPDGGTFVGNMKLDRLDFNVGKSTMMVKDSVEVTITVPVKK